MLEGFILAAGGTGTKVILGIVALLVLFIIIVLGRFINIWIQAISSRAKVSFLDLIGMWLRKVNPQLIVSARISAVQAGIDNVATTELESVFLQLMERGEGSA